MNFDDPKPAADTRKMQQITLRPSLKDKIDQIAHDRKVTRSQVIEWAITFYLKEKDQHQPKANA